MRRLTSLDAYTNLTAGMRDRSYRYPTKTEPGYRDGYLLPPVRPSFQINAGDGVFTIGSCFAREVEKRLVDRGLKVPVAGYGIPADELPYAGPHLLNEYNLGTILQRISSVFGEFAYDDAAGVEEVRDGALDLFLHIHQKPVSLGRLVERRRQIAALYERLRASSVLVLTLGLVEAWFDEEAGCFLNKAPSRAFTQRFPGRFSLCRMDFEDVYSRLSKLMALVGANTDARVLLTVSPVPIEATFSGSSAIIANTYSKSVLRGAAQVVAEEHAHVDYFPSYEIALSRGTSGFRDDNVHVLAETVDAIMAQVSMSYLGEAIDEGQAAAEATPIDRDAAALLQAPG